MLSWFSHLHLRGNNDQPFGSVCPCATRSRKVRLHLTSRSGPQKCHWADSYIELGMFNRIEQLGALTDYDLTAYLPDSIAVEDIRVISVWCRTAFVSSVCLEVNAPQYDVLCTFQELVFVIVGKFRTRRGSGGPPDSSGNFTWRVPGRRAASGRGKRDHHQQQTTASFKLPLRRHCSRSVSLLKQV